MKEKNNVIGQRCHFFPAPPPLPTALPTHYEGERDDFDDIVISLRLSSFIPLIHIFAHPRSFSLYTPKLHSTLHFNLSRTAKPSDHFSLFVFHLEALHSNGGGTGEYERSSQGWWW